MEIPFIATTSLVWLIYTYLFIEADRQILDLFNRLKFSLAINNEGVIEKLQLDVKMYLGIPEVISLGLIFKQGDPHKINIERFKNKITNIESFKFFLILNLFALTIHSLFCFLSLFLLQLHIIFSLFLGLYFYWYTQKLPQLKFSVVKSIEQKNDKL